MTDEVLMPHAVIRVRLLTTAEGGRKTAIQGVKDEGQPVRYGCPVFINGHAFDCRFWPFAAGGYELGKEYDIPIRFLWPERAMEWASPGAKITLWEGKTIAVGHVLTASFDWPAQVQAREAKMNRPIIVFPEIMLTDDVFYFDSVEAAEGFLEPPDIADLVIYDCEGVRLSAKVEHRRTSFWATLLLVPVREVVVISEDVPRSQNADDLRSRIKEYLQDVGHPIDGNEADSLDVLIPQVRKWARCG